MMCKTVSTTKESKADIHTQHVQQSTISIIFKNCNVSFAVQSSNDVGRADADAELARLEGERLDLDASITAIASKERALSALNDQYLERHKNKSAGSLNAALEKVLKKLGGFTKVNLKALDETNTFVEEQQRLTARRQVRHAFVMFS